MSLIPAAKLSLLVEQKASMDNWEIFIEKAGLAISKGIKNDEKTYKLKLAYEELISNIIRSAEENEENNITLKISCGSSEINGNKLFTLQTEDDGLQFDPGYNTEDGVDTEQNISDREIGGLGIFLIKQSVDLANYEWSNGTNKNQISMQTE